MSVIVVTRCRLKCAKFNSSCGSIPDPAGAARALPEPQADREGLPALPKNHTHAVGPLCLDIGPSGLIRPFGPRYSFRGICLQLQGGIKRPWLRSLRSSPPRSATAQAFTRMTVRRSAPGHPVFCPLRSISALLSTHMRCTCFCGISNDRVRLYKCKQNMDSLT